MVSYNSSCLLQLHLPSHRCAPSFQPFWKCSCEETSRKINVLSMPISPCLPNFSELSFFSASLNFRPPFLSLFFLSFPCLPSLFCKLAALVRHRISLFGKHCRCLRASACFSPSHWPSVPFLTEHSLTVLLPQAATHP